MRFLWRGNGVVGFPDDVGKTAKMVEFTLEKRHNLSILRWKSGENR